MKNEMRKSVQETRTLIILGIITVNKGFFLMRTLVRLEGKIQDDDLFALLRRIISVKLEGIKNNHNLLNTIRKFHTEDLRNAHSASVKIKTDRCTLLYEQIIKALL